MTHEEFEKFSEFFYRKTGIQFQDSKKYYVERRIADRVRETRSETFRDYFTLIRFQASGEELQLLVNAMTVNETYFLREDYQFDALVGGILPDIARRKDRGSPIRIWSIPCSSGEEPYSIAISILERWDQADDWNIEILASDIDFKDSPGGADGPVRRAIRFQSIGAPEVEVFRSASLVALSKSVMTCGDRSTFSLVNVIDPLQTRRFRNIDVIFCRNMLIYFDDIGRRQTVEMFFDALSPGGYICLGHSESMSRMSSVFLPQKFGDTLVYQKPRSGE